MSKVTQKTSGRARTQTPGSVFITSLLMWLEKNLENIVFNHLTLLGVRK